MPMDFLNACVRASVLLISSENISLPAMAVNGVSGPKDWAIPKMMRKDVRSKEDGEVKCAECK